MHTTTARRSVLTAFDGDDDGDDEAVGFEQIDAMITDRAKGGEGQTDEKIDQMLLEIESQLKKEKA